MEVSHIILKMGQPLIISAQIYEQQILMFFYSLKICIIGIIRIKHICGTTHCQVSAVTIGAHFSL